MSEEHALYFVRRATRVSPLRLARATVFMQPSSYHSAGYGSHLYQEPLTILLCLNVIPVESE